MRGVFVFFLLFFGQTSVAMAQQSDAFLVTIFDRSIRVLAPDTATTKIGVVIQNNTLSSVRGKVVSEDGHFSKQIHVLPETRVSFEMPLKDGVKNTFISLAPAFQEVDLVVGKKTYEIPPKK